MYAKNVLAAGALVSAAAAIPMAKRDIVWVTQTDEAVVTVPVTTTVWVDASSATHYGHNHHKHSTTSSAVSVAPVSSVESSIQSTTAVPTPSSTSVYVAPTTSSTSEYVAPTTSTSVYVAPTTSTSIYVAPTTSTSVWVAPTTSTSVYVAPTTSTSVYVAPTTSTSSAPAATSSASSGSGLTYGPGASGTSYTGDLTWYATGLGSCGITSGPSDHIVAVSHILYDSYSAEAAGNPNNNPVCGKTVSIVGKDGSTYTATVVDRCTGCAEGDLDLSENYFNTVTENGNGRVSGMSWKFD